MKLVKLQKFLHSACHLLYTTMLLLECIKNLKCLQCDRTIIAHFILPQIPINRLAIKIPIATKEAGRS